MGDRPCAPLPTRSDADESDSVGKIAQRLA